MFIRDGFNMQKNFILFMAFLVGSFAEPGNRPDQNPNFFTGLFYSIEDIIIEHAEDLIQIKEKMENASDKDGWFSDSPKKKLSAEFKIQAEKLKNSLSSVPSGGGGELKKEQSDKESSDLVSAAKSNNEVIEVSFSLENVNGLLAKFQEEFAAKPDDLELAVKYYRVFLVCLENVIELHHSFIENAGSLYLVEIEQKIAESRNLLIKLEQYFNSDVSAEAKAHTEQNIAHIKSIIKELDAAKPILFKQRDWAKENVRQMIETHNTVKLTLETVKIVKSVSEIIKSINRDFQQLKFQVPPLIRFSVNDQATKLNL